MLDVKWIVNNPEEFNRQMDRRGESIRAEKIIKLYNKNKKRQQEKEENISYINKWSKEIGIEKKKGNNPQHLIDKVVFLKNAMKQMKEYDGIIDILEKDLEEVNSEISKELDKINKAFTDSEIDVLKKSITRGKK